MESSAIERPTAYPSSPTYQYDEGYRPLHDYSPDDIHQGKQENVGQLERYGSMVAGAAMLVSGLAKGKLGGLTLAAVGGSFLYRGWTGHCSVYQQLGIDTCDSHSKPSTAIPAKRGVKVEKSLIVNQPVEMLYAFWRDLSNLPTVMTHLQSVEQIDDTHSRWVSEAPFGQTVQWEAEIINERENEMIAWRSVGDSQVDTAGSVHFKALGHDRGTAVTVQLKYDPPGGKLGVGLAYLFGDHAEQQIDEDLRRFKQMMETGELPTAAVTPPQTKPSHTETTS